MCYGPMVVAKAGHSLVASSALAADAKPTTRKGASQPLQSYKIAHLKQSKEVTSIAWQNQRPNVKAV